MRALGILATSFSVLVLASCGQAGDAPQSSSAPFDLTKTSWALDTAASRISFASIKSGEVIETHYFRGLSGDISEDGNAKVEIPLDMVETKIDIRNERMRNMFFETGTYPVARISVTQDLAAFADLKIGKRVKSEITATLSLHGVESEIIAEAFVTRIAKNKVEIASAEPVILYLSDFNLEAGLEALRQIAGLPAITASSPVTFTFVFDASPA